MTDGAFIFERFRLSPEQRTLLENGAPVRLGGRALDILITLARANGEMVSSGQILAEVWRNIYVDQTSLRVHVSALRRALGQRSAGGAFILNVPGRGYKLVGDIHRETRAAVAPTSPSGPGRSPPSNIMRLIGRDDLVEELSENLPRRQFLTVVGPGGVGKTSLALEVVSRLAGRYDQVAFADLSAISDPALVGRTVALAFGLTLAIEDPTPAIVALLHGRRCLLLLDNCEHLIEASATLAETLCEGAPGLDLLATSREPLRACKEWVHRLPPLSFPTEGTALSAAESLRYAAIELFVERASAQTNEFRFTDDEASLVGDICRKLEGVPLAIELAASWAGVLPLKELAERLEGRLMLRAQGRRAVPARHRNLRATIDWSHALLEEPEQRLFRRLSVFAGEFTMESAAAVATDDTLSGEDVFDALAALVSKSLASGSARRDRATYHLLMAPRAYAAERLDLAGETSAIRRRHLLWTLDELKQSEARWDSTSHADWLRDHRCLVDEVRAAAAWAISDDGDLDLALELACDTSALWFRYSLTFEGRALAEAVMRRFEILGRTPPDKEMQLRTALGVALMYTRAPNADVVDNWVKVLEIADAAGEVENQMLAHWGLWLMAAYRCDPRGKLRHAEAFAAMVRQRESVSDLATAERLLASAHFALGDLELARTGITRTLELLADFKPAPGVMRFQFEQAASAHALLARIHWLQGQFDRARSAAYASVEAAEQAGHGLSLAYAVLDGLAHTAILLGDAALAHAALDRHLAMPEAQGLQATEAVDAMRAIALADEDQLEAAASILGRVFADPGATRLAGRFPSLIGRASEILGAGGRPQLGLALVDDTLTRFVQDPNDVMAPDLLRARAVLLAALGQDGSASRSEALLNQAKQRALEIGATAWELRATINLVQQADEIDREAALQSLAAVYNRLGDGVSADRLAAERWLDREPGETGARSNISAAG